MLQLKYKEHLQKTRIEREDKSDATHCTIKVRADQHDEECCGCWMWNGGMRADGRYGKIRIGNTTVNAHHAAYMAANECIDLPLYIIHVFHRNLCVNTNHLSQEDLSINMDREACQRIMGQCTSHQSPIIYKECILNECII